MSDEYEAGDSAGNAAKLQKSDGPRRRWLIKTAQIGAAMPVVLTISHRAWGGGGGKGSVSLSSAQSRGGKQW
jgi:hypothetical protein